MKPCRFALAAALAAALLPAYAKPASAQAEDDEGTGGFHLDPIQFGPLFTDVSTSSSKFEEYRDMDDGVVVPLLRLTGKNKDGSRLFTAVGRNLGREDERYTLGIRESGRYSAEFDFNRIPHRFGNEGRTLWAETEPGRLEISDATQASLQGQNEHQFATNPSGINFAYLDSLLAPHIAAAPSIDLRLERARSHARVDVSKMHRLSWAADFTTESRTGNRPYGAGFGFSNATEVAEPIDYDTTGLELAGEWRGLRSGMRFGYNVSAFQNHIDTLTYDNPFRATDSTDPSAYSSPGSGSIGGSSTGRNALAPDNVAHGLFANGNGKIGAKGWYNAGFNFSAMSQDEDLLPYTTNTAINPAVDPASGAPFDATNAGNLPVSSADRSVHTFNLNGKGGTAFGKANLLFRYRLYDYADKSDRVEFPGYVRFDAVWEAIGRITVPSDYTRQTGGVELGYNLGHKSHANFSYQLDHWSRELREVDKTNEHSLKAQFDTRARDNVTIRGTYEHARRTIGPYSPEAQEDSFTHSEGITNQPDLRKFDEAARKSDLGGIQAQWAADKLDFTLGFSGRKDKYDESVFGLISDRIWNFNGEMSYAIRYNANAYLFYTHADRRSFQAARQSGGSLSTNPADDWELTLKERTDTLGLGFNGSFRKKWTADLTAQWNRGNGDSGFFSPPGGAPDAAVGFPEYDDNEYWTMSAAAHYDVSEHVKAGLQYRHEDYTVDRFARDGLSFYNASAINLNANDGAYNAEVVFADVRINF